MKTIYFFEISRIYWNSIRLLKTIILIKMFITIQLWINSLVISLQLHLIWKWQTNTKICKKKSHEQKQTMSIKVLNKINSIYNESFIVKMFDSKTAVRNSVLYWVKWLSVACFVIQIEWSSIKLLCQRYLAISFCFWLTPHLMYAITNWPYCCSP